MPDNEQAQTPEIVESSPQKVLRRIEIKIPAMKGPERLDVFLTRQVAELTRSIAQDMITSGAITVSAKKVKPSYKVKPGDFISFDLLSRPTLEVEAEDLPLEILFEDEWLVIINKAAGMVMHPATGNRTGTMVNALLHHYESLAESDDPNRPGVVHRLDKETTGVLVICKQQQALSALARAFRERTIRREYVALVWWNMPSSVGVVDAALARDPHDRLKYTTHPTGKLARTHWRVLESFEFLTLCALRLETGRTHQIRVHMQSIQHPVFGDPDYSGRNRQLGKLSSAQRKEVAGYLQTASRQMLHARTLGFTHPMTGEEMEFSADIPPDFAGILEELREIKATRERGKIV